MTSAIHIALQEGLSETDVQITVHTPNVRVKGTVPDMHASEWIANNIRGVDEWATLCATMLVKSSYERVIQSYPWKEATTMRNILPILCLRSVINVQHSHHDPALLGMVDAILPPLDRYLTPYGVEAVLQEVRAHLSRQTHSLLEFYETVYDLVREGSASTLLESLHSQVFETY